MKNHYEDFNPGRIVLMIIGGIIIAVVLAFIFGLVVMFLWNWLMPEIFKLPRITYWQAWGLVLLTHILFKLGAHPFGHSKPSRHSTNWKNKLRNKITGEISEEIRNEIKKEIHKEFEKKYNNKDEKQDHKNEDKDEYEEDNTNFT